MEANGEASVEDAPDVTDPDALVRWLGIASLVASAEMLLDRGGGIWPALSIISADAAIEALLGMIAVPTDDKEQFQELYGRARAVLKANGLDLPPGMPVRIQTAHRFRNTGLHLGSEVPASIARNAIKTARDLRSFVRSQSKALSIVDDVGIVATVGQLSGVKAIQDAMASADAALGANRWQEALDQAAIALQTATGRLDPAIDPREFAPNMNVYRDSDRRLPELKRWVDKRLDHHEEWMVAIAMGLHPVEYRNLLRTVGRVTWYMDGHYEVRRTADVNQANAEGGVRAVVDVIFRLAQLGAIRKKERWE